MVKPSVLIVEDDLEFSEEIKCALSSRAYPIYTAPNAAQAKLIFSKYRPEIVLLDKRLPDADGQDLVSEIKKESAQTQCIIITGYASMDSIVGGLRNGIIDYLTKPVGPERVIESIDYALKQKSEKNKEINAVKHWGDIQLSKYQALFESAKEAIFVADPKEGLIIDCNQAALVLLGYSKEELVGKNTTFLYPKDKIAQYKEIFTRHINSKQITKEGEVVTKDGQIILVLISASLVSLNGESYVQGVFHDLREIKKVQELKRYDSLKSEFVRNVAHEISNPLYIIKEAMLVMNESLAEVKNKKIKISLDILIRETDRLIRFTKNMLDLSKIASGKMPYTPSIIELKPLLDDMLKVYSEQCSKKNIKLIFDINSCPLAILADRDLLDDVLTNLLNNAIKYSVAGKSIVVRVLEDNGFMRLEVKDQGPGIPKQEQDKIFDEFYRVSQDRQSGTGLGLSIVKEIVDLHKGRIWVESEPGKGSTFIVALPLGLRKEER